MFDDLDHPEQRAFLTAYTIKPRINYAAKCAGISRRTHWAWLHSDKRYAKAFAAAEQIAGDVAEDEAKRRGIEGVLEPVIYKGEPVMMPLRDEDGKPVLDAAGNPEVRPLMRRKVSDRLLALILQGAKPERYAKRVEHSGEIQVSIADRLEAGRARMKRGES